MNPRIVTLTTDFGTSDPYVGVMKGVILRICPGVQLIDLTHHIAPQNVAGGALQLERAAPWFPPTTIHLAVVDPGVGGQRRALALRTPLGFFVGPDNGLLTRAAPPDAILESAQLTCPRDCSATFHGRDLFAPAAACLASGCEVRQLGPPLTSPPQQIPETAEGRVLWIDHFGNIILDLHRDRLPGVPRWFRVGRRRLKFYQTYSQVKAGQLLCLFGSDGYLELACNRGNAAQILQLPVGSVAGKVECSSMRKASEADF